MTEVALQAVELVRRIEGAVSHTLVNGIDLAVNKGEFVAITGPSGSGKSSLLYLLGLLDAPSEGEVVICGQPTSKLSESDRADVRLTKCGFVFQFHFLLPEFTSLDNVLLPMRAAGKMAEAEMRERGLALLGSLGLAEHANKRPNQLSGGQRQRVAIARACQPPRDHRGRRADRRTRYGVDRTGVFDPPRYRGQGPDRGRGDPRSSTGRPRRPPHPHRRRQDRRDHRTGWRGAGL